MTLKRALVVAVVALTTPALAQRDPSPQPLPNPGAAPQADGLVARQPLPRKSEIIKPAGQSRLIVKFADQVKARVLPDLGVRSAAGADMTMVDAIVQQYNLTFVPAIKSPDATLQSVQQRAAAISGKAQPDLEGMMYIEGNDAVLLPAAKALNNLAEVEFIYFEEPFRPSGGTGACCVPANGVTTCGVVTADTCGVQGGLYQGDGTDCTIVCPDLGACCIAGDECVTLTEADCIGVAGTYRGDGTNCILDGIDCANEGCGDPLNGSCFATHLNPFCDDEDCCEIVGGIRPFCVNEDFGQWDALCVAIAHLFCAAPPADRCSSFINGSCFEEHGPPGGCIDNGCCNIVCAIDPFCCEQEWDGGCVDQAQENCIVPGAGGPTPDLTAQQGYLRRLSYAGQPGGVPAGLSPPAPLAIFQFAGEGLYLFDDSLMTDHPGVAVPRRYAGLYGLGREMNEVYGVGEFNGARGRDIKVAVIEWAFFENHEDLDVISEPGQTLITIPEVGFPDHATACLGIINGQINGFGVNGIAPDAQAYFFPLTSVEEGPREHTAWVNAMATLAEGDVISCSYGGGGNLGTNQATWLLIRMAADLGITACISAGNDCANMDDTDDLGDHGGIIVGAGSGGRSHSRLTFSNHFTDGTGSQVVHVQSWGEAVTTVGGSANLRFPAGNWNRSYCSNFNGTSAAAPQVAGVVACLQGFAKQFYGIPLMPAQIRNAIAATGFPQGAIPNPDDLPGFDEANGCGPDTDPEQEPKKIGPYPRPERAGAHILNQTSAGFDDAPLIDGVTVIRGEFVFGNQFSIKGSDNNYFVVRSLHTPRRHRPNMPSPASQVTYLATAQTTDIMVNAHVDVLTDSLQVNVELAPPGPLAFHVIELFDFTTGRWSLVDFQQIPTAGPGPGAPDVLLQSFAVNAARFVEQSNHNRVFIRLYAFAPAAPSPFTIRYDLVDLVAFDGFGGGGVGGGGGAFGDN